MKNARAKRAKILFFIFKYANSCGNCCRRRELIGHVKNRIQYKSAMGGLQPISRDSDNNAAMYNCWWTNKRS